MDGAQSIKNSVTVFGCFEYNEIEITFKEVSLSCTIKTTTAEETTGALGL